MTDRGHDQPTRKGLYHQPLQCLAVDVAAHSAGPVPARKQQCVDPGQSGLCPAEGVLELDRLPHQCIAAATVFVGSKHPTDERDGTQDGKRRPDVQTSAAHHDVVGDPRSTAFGGKNDPMAVLGQHAPADRNLGGVEITVRDRNQDGAHAVGPRPP